MSSLERPPPNEPPRSSHGTGAAAPHLLLLLVYVQYPVHLSQADHALLVEGQRVGGEPRTHAPQLAAWGSGGGASGRWEAGKCSNPCGRQPCSRAARRASRTRRETGRSNAVARAAAARVRPPRRHRRAVPDDPAPPLEALTLCVRRLDQRLQLPEALRLVKALHLQPSKPKYKPKWWWAVSGRTPMGVARTAAGRINMRRARQRAAQRGGATAGVRSKERAGGRAGKGPAAQRPPGTRGCPTS